MSSIIKNIDELGRIVIPKEIRKELLIKKDDKIEIKVDDEAIILKKVFNKDYFEIVAAKIVDIFCNYLQLEIDTVTRNKILSKNSGLDLIKSIRFFSDNDVSYFEEIGYKVIVPVFVNSVCLGILLSKVNEEKFIKIIRDLIIYYLEI